MRAAKIAKKKNVLLAITKSIWLFPIICTVVILLLTAFKISGSSIGVYNNILYGPSHKDSNLLLNKPREIRSDEWVWNSQMVMAQASNHFNRINPYIGHGQDMSVIIDVPYKDWSAVFRPQNLVFFALPFQYAFALKWWIMAYLLVLSCYFFVLFFFPKKRLMAAAISLALLFSPFIQWWYQYITLAPIYYSLFLLVAFMKLLKTEAPKHKILWGLAIAYLLTCFILVLYPPFQIACAMAAGAFAVGYLLNQRREMPAKLFLKNIGVLAASIAVAGILSLLFIYTRHDAINRIQNTAYPGKRIINSGGYEFAHLFSGHLDFQLQFESKAIKYQWPKNGLTNQSEDSNFVLFMPFLIAPFSYLAYKEYRKKKQLDWVFIGLSLTFLGFIGWLFVPHIPLALSKLTLLSKVPQGRLIIGLGLLNLLMLVAFMSKFKDIKEKIFPRKLVLLYAVIIFIIELALALHAKNTFPGFIGIYRCVAFSLPVPVIIYLLLTKKFEWAAIGFMAFSIFMTMGVHPFYRGTDIITDSQLSRDIKKIASKDSSNWGVEDAYLENFAFLNGAHSLSGIFSYPQLDIWSQIKGADPTVYNRYAHTNFTFYRDAGQTPTRVELTGGDHFGVDTEPCGSFLKQNNVRFLLTDVPLGSQDTCLQIVEKIDYPARTVYIYHTH